MGLGVRKSTILSLLIKAKWKFFLTQFSEISPVQYIQNKCQGNYKHKPLVFSIENTEELEKIYDFPLYIKGNSHVRKNAIAIVDFPGELFQLISSKGSNIYEKTNNYVQKYRRYSTVLIMGEGSDVPAFRKERHKIRAAASRSKKKPYTVDEMHEIFNEGADFSVDRLMISPNYKCLVTKYFRDFVASDAFKHFYVFHNDGVNSGSAVLSYDDYIFVSDVKIYLEPVRDIYEAENKCGYLARVLNKFGTDVFCGDGDFIVIALLNQLNVQIFASAVKTVFQSPYVSGFNPGVRSSYTDAALVAYHLMFIGGNDYTLLTEFNGIVGTVPKTMNCSSLGLQKSQFETVEEISNILHGRESCFTQLYKSWDPLDIVSGRVDETDNSVSTNYIAKFIHSSRALLCNLSTSHQRRLDYALQYLSILLSSMTYYTVLIVRDKHGKFVQGYRDSCFSLLLSLVSEISRNYFAKYIAKKKRGVSVIGVHPMWNALYPGGDLELRETFNVSSNPANGPKAGQTLEHVYICTNKAKYGDILYADGRPKKQTSFSGFPEPPSWFRVPPNKLKLWEAQPEPPKDVYIGGFNTQIICNKNSTCPKVVRAWSFANKVGSDIHEQIEHFINDNKNDNVPINLIDNKWPIENDLELLKNNFALFRKYMCDNDLLFLATELPMGVVVSERFLTGTTDVILIDRPSASKLKKYVDTILTDGDDSFCTVQTRKKEPIVRIILGDWKIMDPFEPEHPFFGKQTLHKKHHYCAQGIFYRFLAKRIFFGYFISQSIIVVLPRRKNGRTQLTIIGDNDVDKFVEPFINPKNFDVYDIKKEFSKKLDENQKNYIVSGKFKHDTTILPQELSKLIWEWRHMYHNLENIFTFSL